MANIKVKPNGVLYLEVRLPDPVTGDLKRSRVSLETRDPDEAKRLRADWLAGRHPKHPAMGGVIAAKGRGPLDGKSTRRTASQKGMTLACWLEDCELTLWRGRKGKSTIASNVRVLNSVVEPDLLLADITSAHIGEIERGLRERHSYAEGSIKKLMGALSSVLNYAADNEDPATGRAWLTARPKFPTYTVRNIRDRVLAEAEEAAMFECIDRRIEAEPARPWRHFGGLLETLLDTGFRLGEGLSLGPASVHTKRWLEPTTGAAMSGVFLSLARYTTKSDKPREVPATQRVLDLIPKLNTLAVKGRWFPWAPGSGGPQYFWLNLRADMAERGFDLSDVSLHTMRHTCATRLAVGGMDLLGLRDWLGHSDIKITAERYVHLMSSHLYRGAAILNLSNGSTGAPGGKHKPGGEGCVMADYLPSGSDHADTGTPVLQ